MLPTAPIAALRRRGSPKPPKYRNPGEAVSNCQNLSRRCQIGSGQARSHVSTRPRPIAEVAPLKLGRFGGRSNYELKLGIKTCLAFKLLKAVARWSCSQFRGRLRTWASGVVAGSFIFSKGLPAAECQRASSSRLANSCGSPPSGAHDRPCF